MEFPGSSAIVTGGSKGIGKAVAAMLLAQGASVILVGRGIEALEQTAHLLGGNVAVVAGDVADADTAQRAVDMAVHEFGGLQLLANIAGAFPTALLEDTTDMAYAETMAANLTGTFTMCRAALPVMRAAGGGSIVNMSSTAARFPTPGLSVYGASKAGIEAFTRAVAMEAAPVVRVNAVSAGPTMTETVAALMASDETGAVAAVTKSIPLGRLGTTDEIADAIIFLLSARASFITGQVLHANGGGIMA